MRPNVKMRKQSKRYSSAGSHESQMETSKNISKMVFHWLIQRKNEHIPVRMQRKRNIKLKTARPVS